MKKCECGEEIREDQKICFSCYKKLKNLRHISRDEWVGDADDRVHGDKILRQIGLLMSLDEYQIEVWRADKAKSYHLHIKNIPHISDLPKKQNELYKKLLLEKYKQKLKLVLGYEPKGFDKLDDAVFRPDNLIAEENKPHHKYKTIKKLLTVINQDYQNYCDREIYRLATQDKEEYKPVVKGSGITAKIIEKINIKDIARQFGLDLRGNKCFCPFHDDVTGGTPSLIFYEEQGRAHCFGCSWDGNIIQFYVALKKLNSEFKYHKEVEKIK